VVIDTGLFLAFLNSADSQHLPARAFWKDVRNGRHGAAIAPDAVYLEGMNYLRRKPARRALCESLRALRMDPGRPIRWVPCDDDALRRADSAFFTHFERGLSMTDAILLATATELDASVATFDQAFRGLVAVVP
jgi:predicted nucleic acid-binding protein